MLNVSLCGHRLRLKLGHPWMVRIRFVAGHVARSSSGPRFGMCATLAIDCDVEFHPRSVEPWRRSGVRRNLGGDETSTSHCRDANMIAAL